MLFDPISNQCRSVLLIDAHRFDRELIEELLVDTVEHVQTATRWSTADVCLEKNDYDAVLVDPDLPDHSGLAVIEKTVSSAPRTAVILLMGLVDPVKAMAATRAGVHDCLAKEGLTREQLCHSILHALERKKLRLQIEEHRRRAEVFAERKDAFAAMIGHEVGNMISGVLGFNELLRKTNLDEDQREYVESIELSARNLSRLSRDLLTWSRVESGQFTYDPVPFRLEETLEGVCRILKGNGPGPEVVLLCDIDPRIPEELVGDPTRLHQVLYNLLLNASNSTTTGHIMLGAHLLKKDPRESTVRFLVEDSGRGIPAENLRQLFESYTQPKGRHNRNASGLGLAICHGLVKALGGRLSARSLVGFGSVFWFDLKLGHTENCFNRAMEKPLCGISMAVVDDYEPSRRILTGMLRGLGATVCSKPEGCSLLLLRPKRTLDEALNDIPEGCRFLHLTDATLDRQTLVGRLRQAIHHSALGGLAL